ncbi:MAG: hypothetical protein ABEK04_01825 [Candidatus Nanohalobium sp.]
MNQEQLVKKIKYSLNDGYTEDELRQVLRSQGISHSQINQAFRQINSGNRNNQNSQQRQQNTSQQQGQNQLGNQNRRPQNQGQNQNFGNSQGNQQFQDNNGGLGGDDQQSFSQQNQQRGSGRSSGGAIPGLDLTDSYYRIKQQMLLNRYSVYDQNDNKVLSAKKKILSIKTDIPFTKDGDDSPIFRVVSESLLNISHNYEVKNEETGENLAILDRKRTIFNQIWRVRDPNDNSIVATIKNSNQMVQFLRTYGGKIPIIPNVFAFIPHTYEVLDVNDNKIGELEGELSVRDQYDLKLQDSGQLDRESMIASIISIDALEGN